MATGVSSIHTTRPSFPSHYFSLLKPCPRSMAMAFSSRSFVAFSKAFHRQELRKIQSSSDTSISSSSPLHLRQEVLRFTSSSVEQKPLSGGYGSDSFKLGDKKSWKEETEKVRSYRMETTSTFCVVGSKEDARKTIKGVFDGREIFQKRYADVNDPLKESVLKAQSTVRIPLFYEAPKMTVDNLNPELKDEMHFDGDGVNGFNKVDLLEKPKATSARWRPSAKKVATPVPNGSRAVIVKTDFPDTNQINVQDHESFSLPESILFSSKVSKTDTDIREQLSSLYGEVLVVDSLPAAKKVVELLTTSYRHLVHACDTEVAKIEVKEETPVDHGEIICFSIYCGPEADFGDGKSCIWVDVLDGGGKEILNEFAPYFEDPSIKKVWHNYSFDNHIIENYGLKVSGFHADTMHMARLWDSSRRAKGGYSLEALTGDPKVMSKANLSKEKKLIGKISMKTIFGKKKLRRDGKEAKMIYIEDVEVLQREERIPWICYSALDAMSTLKLYESLRSQLSKKSLKINGKPVAGKSMFDFYIDYWQPFGELLVKMETEGMLVDRSHLAKMEKVAKNEQEIAVNRFRKWASKYCTDAKDMNVSSDTQLRQLFFGGIVNKKNFDESLPLEKIFKIPNVDKVIEEGKKAPTKFRNIKLHKIDGNFIPSDFYTASGWPSMSINALKILAGKVSAEFDFMGYDAEDSESADEVEESLEASETKVPDNQEQEKQCLAKSDYGTAFTAFPSEDEGREACHAVAALCEVCAIDTLISSFILPLQNSNISGKGGRIHCSLNINTETGRLSARRPNLQNQPALEKDRYKIRQAFIAAPGNSLIVADYGQLELRILAHLSNCKSMLDAFKAGGDFHSRTAMNMYPHIREAIKNKEVCLEWDPQPGEDKPPVPLLKDAFAAERRKAKMLNFSIAYGKTPVGLARDWKVSVEEAEDTVDLWYKERQEVLRWQHKRKVEARKDGCVRTLLGRTRCFPSMVGVSYAQRNHIERAAINAPVQGSAADVAMCAMLEISANETLKELGWRLLLQVHDEVILEGPTESAEVAKAIVIECMSKPFNGTNILKVDLAVDADYAQNWYAAK